MAAQIQPLLTSSLISGFKQSQNFDPYRVSHWTLVVDNLPGAESLALAVENGASPIVGFDEILLSLGNDRIRLPGQATTEPMAITFRDFINPHIGAILAAWWRTIYNPYTGHLNFAQNFKKVATLISWSTLGSHQRSWTLEGLWPLTSNFGTLEQQNSDIVRAEAQFVYDRAIDNLQQSNTVGNFPASAFDGANGGVGIGPAPGSGSGAGAFAPGRFGI